MQYGRWPLWQTKANKHACPWWLSSSHHLADAGLAVQVTMYLDDGSPTPSYPVAGQEYMPLKLGDVVEVVLQNNAAWLNGTASEPASLHCCLPWCLLTGDVSMGSSRAACDRQCPGRSSQAGATRNHSLHTGTYAISCRAMPVLHRAISLKAGLMILACAETIEWATKTADATRTPKRGVTSMRLSTASCAHRCSR